MYISVVLLLRCRGRKPQLRCLAEFQGYAAPVGLPALSIRIDSLIGQTLKTTSTPNHLDVYYHTCYSNMNSFN